MPEILKACNVIFKNRIHYPLFCIEDKKATFLQGPSGCGKSTLLKLFNGTISPDCGTIYYHGQNIQEIEPVLLRQKVLLVSQSVYLFSDSIENNFIEYYRYRELENPDRKHIQQYLSLCCADFPLDTMCDRMSGGERQRVYIAICMSLAPDVLMLDEPSSALDTRLADHMMGNIKQYCKEQGITLVSVSHDTVLTEKYADEIVRLEGCAAI